MLRKDSANSQDFNQPERESKIPQTNTDMKKENKKEKTGIEKDINKEISIMRLNELQYDCIVIL